MLFNDVFNKSESVDVLLIQPNMLQQIKPEYIDPVQTDYWNSLEQIGSLFGVLPIEPNWGLLYIASNLKKFGYKVGMLDFHLYDYIMFERTQEFINQNDLERILSKKKYKVVGISAMTLSHYHALNVAKICKKINPNCTVILGGIHFSFMAREILENEKYVDVILSGEGEESFVHLMQLIEQKEKWKTIEGINYRNEDEILLTDSPAFIKDLDSLPFPDYTLWPQDIPIIPRIYTARGCNGGCSYCVVNQFFCNKYRKRDINKVFDELKYVVSNFECKDFLIGDLNLGARKEEIVKLCKLIIKEELHIKWWCQTRQDGLDEELISFMAKAGCVQIGIGIESADESILDSSVSIKANKKLSTKLLCHLIQKYDIEVQGYFIIGLPGETMETAINTINLIDILTINDYVDVTHIAVLVPYPGTPVYENNEEFDIEILSKDYSKYLMNCDYMNAGVPVVSTRMLSNLQIYALWQLAISTASKNFKRRTKCEHRMFNQFNQNICEIKFA